MGCKIDCLQEEREVALYEGFEEKTCHCVVHVA